MRVGGRDASALALHRPRMTCQACKRMSLKTLFASAVTLIRLRRRCMCLCWLGRKGTRRVQGTTSTQLWLADILYAFRASGHFRDSVSCSCYEVYVGLARGLEAIEYLPSRIWTVFVPALGCLDKVVSCLVPTVMMASRRSPGGVGDAKKGLLYAMHGQRNSIAIPHSLQPQAEGGRAVKRTGGKDGKQRPAVCSQNGRAACHPARPRCHI